MSATSKRICVIGLGGFGSELARRLARECEVLAIDLDGRRVDDMAEQVQQALRLDARDFASLRSVISGDFSEAVISVGDNIEVSVLCTLHLSRLGVKKIWAKAVSDDHADILRAVGADQIIFPERETARRLAAKIRNPNLLDFVPLESDYRVTELAPPADFVGKSLKDLRLRNRFDVFVVAVKELVPERFVFLPRPEFVVKDSDILVLIGREQDILRIKDAKPGEAEPPAAEGETDEEPH